MDNRIEDSVGELVRSEQLQAFCVVEIFCEECGDLTPHHIDQSEKKASSSEASSGTNFVAPISLHECVFCRENEESWLGDI